MRALALADRRCHLIIVGDGLEHAALTHLVRDLGVVGRVLLAGSQPSTLVHFAAADCVVSSSRYDTFPNVLLEGQALGRPVLVPRDDPPRVYAGFAETVSALGGGWTYERDRPETLAACFNRLAASPETVRAAGVRARDVAARRSWNNAVAAIHAHGLLPDTTLERVMTPGGEDKTAVPCAIAQRPISM